jgi:hypothetical protein
MTKEARHLGIVVSEPMPILHAGGGAYLRFGYPKERHGMSKTLTWRSWVEMRRRCYHVGYPRFKHYGGRGINVCDAWNRSFTAFYNYIGERLSKAYELDRINVDGNYEPGNVRWNIRGAGARRSKMEKAA